MSNKRYIAIAGDFHGNEQLFFDELDKWRAKNHKRIDAACFLGDWDTVAEEVYRSPGFVGKPDYRTNLVSDGDPPLLSTLVDYSLGKKEKPPYPIFFVAGNHDDWNVLAEVKFGGDIAEDVYFLGRAGVKDFLDIRIAGLSGVYRSKEYRKPLPKEPNLWWQYFRRCEVQKLRHTNPDILLLHDWIAPYSSFTSIKEEDGIQKSQQAYPSNNLDKLVESIQPRFVFMGHRHKSYIEGRIGSTKVFGLKRVTRATLNSGFCYKVIAIEPKKLKSTN